MTTNTKNVTLLSCITQSVISRTDILTGQFNSCLACFLRQRLHDEWLERERLAQEEFRLQFEREEAVRLRREEEEVTYCLFSYIMLQPRKHLGEEGSNS